MDNYSINLLSEKIYHFSTGKIYLVEIKSEIVNKELFNSDNALYLNYPFQQAKKIYPSFEKLGARTQNKLAKAIQANYGYRIMAYDALGQLVVLLYLDIELYDLLIVGLVGLGPNAINEVIEISKKLILNKKNKTIIFTKISPELDESATVTII